MLKKIRNTKIFFKGDAKSDRKKTTSGNVPCLFIS